jgi:hypothetical protein
MKTAISFAAVLLAFAFNTVPAHAQSRIKDCATQWNALKAEDKTGDKTYREFQKDCLSKASELAKEAGANDVKSDKAVKKKSAKVQSGEPKTAKVKKPSSSRAAMAARRKACSEEWKTDKAAGKIVDGMKWPQYWSACNKRKKGEAA